MITAEQIEILKESLPRDARKTIWDRMNGKFSLPYIDRVLNGTRFNKEIMDTAISLAEEEKQSIEAMAERIATLKTRPVYD